jgi:hypothetical protein
MLVYEAEPEPIVLQAGALSVPILFEDEHLLVVDKSARDDGLTLDRVGEANQPKWNGHCPKSLGFHCSDLYLIKGKERRQSLWLSLSLWHQENFVHQSQKTYSRVPHWGGILVLD